MPEQQLRTTALPAALLGGGSAAPAEIRIEGVAAGRRLPAGAKLLQQQKSAEKRERKERATERNEQKAGAKKKEGEAVAVES